jgi:phosphoribosyl-ATP pyrophosphohydrolase/phosphoribosyl-AMP cyclohydrolase
MSERPEPRAALSEPPSLDGSALRWDAQGLIPGVVQDATTGRVLMLGYLDAQALQATLRTGLAHFHSRSRGRLWRKGESSGNALVVREVRVDCDGDALLIVADPCGPTCHTGSASCFERGLLPAPPAAQLAETPAAQGFAWLENLWRTIVERSLQRPAGSYTAALLDGGVDAVSRKVVEEAAEVLMAAKDDAVAQAPTPQGAAGAAAGSDAGPSSRRRATTQAALAAEAADLLYHLLVLCRERGLAPAAVMEILRRRHTL